MAGQAKKWLAKVAPLGWAVLLLVVLLLLCDNYLSGGGAFNTDNLYCWDLCGDVMAGRLLTGWHLPGAPYFFPDMLLLLPIRCLTSSPLVGFCAYCFVLYLLMLAALTWLARLTGLPWREAGLLSCTGLVFLLAAYLDPPYGGRAQLLFHAGSHVGLILLGLAAIAFSVRTLQQGLSWQAAGLAVLVGAVATYSDRLLAVQFLAPAVLALLVLMACRRVPWRRALALVAILSLAAGLYLPIRIGMSRLGFQTVSLDTGAEKSSPLALAALLANLWPDWRKQYVLQAILPLSLLAAGALAITCFRRRVDENETPAGRGLDRMSLLFVALFLLSSPLCNIAAMLGTGQAENPAVLRYGLTCFMLPFLFLGLLLRWLPGWAARSAVGFRLAVFAFTIYQAYLFVPAMSRQHFELPYPPLARELDRLARERGPMRGLAGFWSARHLTALSREGVRLNVVTASGQPWLHANSPDRYLSPDPRDLRLPAFNFIIVSRKGLPDPDVRPEDIEREYGPPREKIAVDQREIWLYDEVSNPNLEKFLLGQLAQRLRRAGKPVGPTTPARLARPKFNLAPWNASGTRAMRPGDSLEVRFATPLSGAALDLSACHDNRYLLAFYHDEQKISTLHVPSVPWTGAAYGEPGLQSRLLPLPEALRTHPWNRVVIKPIGESAHFSVGHFLVWPNGTANLPTPPSPTPRRFEAENLPTSGDANQLNVTEPSASGGKVRHAPPDFTGALAFGPYAELPAGRYQATFVLRVGAGPSGRVATLDVRANGGLTLLAERILSASDLPSHGGYAPVSVTFNTDADLDGVEFRLFPAGTRDVWLDYIDLLPLPSQP
jgi:hypothetical protein